MWRRLIISSHLQTLAPLRSASTLVARYASGASIHRLPSPISRSDSDFVRRYSATGGPENVVKRVEDVMPIATGHEREEMEAELEGRDILEINHPEGPFGTKVMEMERLL